LACALLLAGFAACTDDFSTPDARSGVLSGISGEVKPGATAAGDLSGISDEGKDDAKDEKDPTAGDGSEVKPGN
jgi:hypothetical protein